MSDKEVEDQSLDAEQLGEDESAVEKDDDDTDSCKDYKFHLASGHAYSVVREGGSIRWATLGCKIGEITFHHREYGKEEQAIGSVALMDAAKVNAKNLQGDSDLFSPECLKFLQGPRLGGLIEVCRTWDVERKLLSVCDKIRGVQVLAVQEICQGSDCGKGEDDDGENQGGVSSEVLTEQATNIFNAISKGASHFPRDEVYHNPKLVELFRTAAIGGEGGGGSRTWTPASCASALARTRTEL